MEVTKDKLKILKMYTAGSRYPGEYSVVAACVAHTHKEAKKLLWGGSNELREECDFNYIEMSVSRSKEHEDVLALIDRKEPHVIKDAAITRRMGWWCEGDSQCASCDLSEMDGDFPLCEHCEQCPECGHSDECISKLETGDVESVALELAQ